MLFSNKNERTIFTCNNMDDSHKHVEQKQTQRSTCCKFK